MKHLLSIFITLWFGECVAQSFEKTFSGQWARTTWTFEFKKDGSFKRASNGHYGNTTYEGKYAVKNDSIHLLSGFENTDATVNEYYLLDRDSFLVDLTLFYDYKLNADSWFYNSRKRDDIEFKVFMSKHPRYVSFREANLLDPSVNANYNQVKTFLASRNENIEDYYVDNSLALKKTVQGGEQIEDSWLRFPIYHVNTMYAWLKFKKEHEEEYNKLNDGKKGVYEMVGYASGKDGIIEVNYTTKITGFVVWK